MAQRLICGKCGGPIVFRREEAREQRIYFDVEGVPTFDDDPIEEEFQEGLFCTACETWYAEDAEDVLQEIPALLEKEILRVTETSESDEEEEEEEEQGEKSETTEV
jgi:uncharacterized protein YbaR (Trm112 family)